MAVFVNRRLGDNTKINPFIKHSSECWEAIEKTIWEEYKKGGDTTQWIYLKDCLERGTVTPAECYECLKIGYVPEFMSFRNFSEKRCKQPTEQDSDLNPAGNQLSVGFFY